VATVRRPGHSIYDRIGTYDMTTDDTYCERGINLLHGFLTEYYVEDPEYLVRVPAGLKHIGVLLEPMSIVDLYRNSGEKALSRPMRFNVG
jgi:hypothetical protein